MAASRKSASTDRLTAAAADCLARHVGEQHTCALGLSGGVDSVVLLHIVRSLHPTLSAVHVHHGLSPDADRWTDFCQDLCTRWHIPLHIHRVDVERGSADGLEAAARRARHAIYDQIDTHWLLLAHHRGDRAETLLFNLLRGTGIRGAGAMPERNGRLLRPLLNVGRSDILDYARHHSLTWVEDTSNADTRYSRNFIRHRIVPRLTERFPAAEQSLAAAARRFAEAADLLDELARLDLGGSDFHHSDSAPSTQNEHPDALDLRLLAPLSEPRARNALRYWLTTQGVRIPGEERLTEALRQLLTAAPDRHPALCFGPHRLYRRGGRLYLDFQPSSVR